MTTKSPLNRLVIPAIALAFSLVHSTCMAETFSATANISGSVTQPSCKFNLGNSLDVKFTDVDVSKISTGQYSVPIELNVTCGVEPASITLTLTGVSGYSPDVIRTDIDGLGIKLVSERLGAVWQPNTSIHTNTGNDNNITAVLIADSGAKFKGGEFSASVSVSVVYD
ncbi:fimbrial protein [Pseudomonas sp.]|uniref:fimbrial protein n=1 Tax=Pseudomonas sp. TaxID=306 RepID=UPI003BB22291